MKNTRYLYIGAGVLQILSAVFWFVPSFSGVTSIISKAYTGEIVRVSVEDLSLCMLMDDLIGFLIASMVGFALSLALIIIPIFRKTCEKRHLMIYPKITAIYSLVVFILAFVSTRESSMEYVSYGGEANLNLGGVVFLILNIALLVVLFAVSTETRKIQKSKKFQGSENFALEQRKSLTIDND